MSPTKLRVQETSLEISLRRVPRRGVKIEPPPKRKYLRFEGSIINNLKIETV
jgi:hypothetical protein